MFSENMDGGSDPKRSKLGTERQMVTECSLLHPQSKTIEITEAEDGGYRYWMVI